MIVKPCGMPDLANHQHAGPKLPMYRSGSPTTAASVHFAHRSRLLKIRTPSQTQKAANATPKAGRTMLMPGIVPAVAWGRVGGRNV
jgi:hypothetical protein